MKIFPITIFLTCLAKGLSAENTEAPKEIPKAEANDQKSNNAILIQFKDYVDGYSKACSDKKIQIHTAYAIDYKVAREKLPEATKEENQHTLLVDHGTSFTLIYQPYSSDRIVFLTITSNGVLRNWINPFIFQLSASGLHTILYENLDFIKKLLEEDKPIESDKHQELFLKAAERETAALKKMIDDESVPEKLRNACKEILQKREEEKKAIKGGIDRKRSKQDFEDEQGFLGPKLRRISNHNLHQWNLVSSQRNIRFRHS